MKTIIYQMFPRWFTNYNSTRKRNGTKQENGCGTFKAITPKALRSIRDLGATHVWYTGVIRHATAEYNHPKITKGLAGSPYAITDYYDVNPDLADNIDNRMREFEMLIERTHRVGLKAIIDFVPNHVSREYKSYCKPNNVRDLGEDDNPEWAFSPLNNFYYLPNQSFAPNFDIGDYSECPAKVTGNDCFSAQPNVNDWYETVKLNYGVFYQKGMEKQFDPIPNTWHKMLEILLFWSSKGVDGFRVDMAEMVPVEFWEWLLPKIKKEYPQVIFIAECYKPECYHAYLHAGFDYLYDKVGMYDYLRGVTSKNWPVEGITKVWQQTDDIRHRMLYFLENHDEQRIASGFYCGRGACAEPAMIVAATLGTNPVMIYAGQELGEKGMDSEGYSGMDGRTTIFDYWGIRSIQAWANEGKFDGKGLDEEQNALRNFYQKLLNIARQNKAITSGKMYDLVYAQSNNFNKHEQFAYLRKSGEQILLMVLNFDDKQVDLNVTIPQEAFDCLSMYAWDRVTAYDMLSDRWLDEHGEFHEIMDETIMTSFTPNNPIKIHLPAWKGVILRIENKLF